MTTEHFANPCLVLPLEDTSLCAEATMFLGRGKEVLLLRGRQLPEILPADLWLQVRSELLPLTIFIVHSITLKGRIDRAFRQVVRMAATELSATSQCKAPKQRIHSTCGLYIGHYGRELTIPHPVRGRSLESWTIAKKGQTT